MLGQKTPPLLLCEVVHSLPGRLRVACRALFYLDQQADEIQERLENLQEIQIARVSAITGNVLVRSTPESATPEQIREMTESIIGSYSLIAYKAERKKQMQSTVNERRLQEEPISEMVMRVGITAVSLLFAVLRPGRAASPFLMKRLLTVPALTSLSLGVPIFKSGVESLRKTWRPNADTLSATAILSSLLAGRDLSALTIIWLADIAELLTAYTMDRTHRAIGEMLSPELLSVMALCQFMRETAISAAIA